MKILIAILAFGAAAICAGAQSVKTFIWDMPTNQPYTSLVYKIYGTTNLATPTNQWPLVANIVSPSVTQSGTKLAYSVGIQPGAWFFTMTSSNFWGESFFSQAAVTPPVPPQLNNLALQRGP